jgi:hypothetical protein
LVAAATDLLAGANSFGTKRYSIIYRAFEHKQMANICRQVAAGNLRNENGQAFHSAILDYATTFVELQENRHEADYDPTARMALSDARAAISKARAAIGNLVNAPNNERFLFLTLLNFKPRS